MELVERRRDLEDRRRYELTMTDAGRGTLSEADSLVEGAQEAVLAPLDRGASGMSCTVCSPAF